MNSAEMTLFDFEAKLDLGLFRHSPVERPKPLCKPAALPVGKPKLVHTERITGEREREIERDPAS